MPGCSSLMIFDQASGEPVMRNMLPGRFGLMKVLSGIKM